MARLSFVRKNHPFIVYSERTVDAEHALWREGAYGNAVMQAALATEILLDALLSMLCWEERAQPTDIADAVFSKPLIRRVKSEYHERLGGVWQTTGTGPVADWAQVLARLRGRVVHRGYRPTRADARRALAVMTALDSFIRERLAANAAKYPRTALLLLGRPGLERLGGWDALATFVAEQADEEPEWVGSFRTWRDELDSRRAHSIGWLQ